ncbi:MAG TPA: hypothetical protein VK186_00190 [Candidatus Deferrimicrobium sp.]|nr:hypothetical protein [Candidatus Deferrimicrobium sp.]
MKKRLLFICVLVLIFNLGITNCRKVPGKIVPPITNAHLEKLKSAFEADNFYIESYIEYPQDSGKFGIRAASNYAVNYQSGKPKLAFYLEGKPGDMGYQMGYLAEAEIARMATIYVKRVLADYVAPELPAAIRQLIGNEINKLMLPGVKKLADDEAIPNEYREQINGLLEGCKKANPKTKVKQDALELLNYGSDVLCAIMYEGTLLQQLGISPDHLKIPFSCNAFSLKGTRNSEDYHYFGRDFQFDNGDVFQDTACMIIYNPDSHFNGIKALPSVVQAAPGMVGGITIMNINGVAMGVNISPSHACDPDNPGLNSLLMVRHSVQYGKDAGEMVARVREAQRGVSWVYPFADGSTGEAGVIEAIKSLTYNSRDELAEYLYGFPLHTPISRVLKNKIKKNTIDQYIPNSDFIKQHMQQYDNLKKGIFVRWSDYNYPSDYLAYDNGLWEWYNNYWSLIFKKRNLHDDGLSTTGTIDRLKLNQSTKLEHEKNCPLTYYFAPLRAGQPGEVLVTNAFISPELRYTAMHYWTALLQGITGYMDDLQWRYDTLNQLIYEALNNGGGSVDKETAKNLIDFLNPLTGQFPGYYSKSPRSKDKKSIQVLGSISLCDLKAKTMESLFGYYSDKWVTITLPRYFEKGEL